MGVGGTAWGRGICCKKGLEGFFLVRKVHFPASLSLKLHPG